jgi:hypothetical protein
MSFGLRDRDWVDPPEPETFRAHCGDCTHFHECPCGKHGWCDAAEEFVDPSEVVTVGDDCCDFDAAASFDPEWEEWEAADQAYDAYKDRQMEEE